MSLAAVADTWVASLNKERRRSPDRRLPKRRFGNRRSLFLHYKRTYGSSIAKAPKNSAHLSKFLPVRNG